MLGLSMDRIHSARKTDLAPCCSDERTGRPGHDWEDWFDIKGGSLAGAYQLLQRIDLVPSRPLPEFNVPIRSRKASFGMLGCRHWRTAVRRGQRRLEELGRNDVLEFRNSYSQRNRFDRR